MPAHGKYGETRGVRWDPEQDCFVMKCDDCVEHGRTGSYWPLTLDFWNPRTMQRCRACDVERRARLERERLRADKPYAERRREASRRYYRENKAVVRAKHTIYMRARRAKQKESAA